MTAEQAAVAHVPGFEAGIRFDGSDPAAYALALATGLRPGPWLALSAGGGDGAFGAGILTGWTEAGTRPDFVLVTGVSTGALLAPYAFLGSSNDPLMRDAYLSTTAADIFEVGDGGRGESLLDTWPLARSIARRITPETLAAVATAHAGGRRLWVVTTNLDTARPVVWDLGAIAARGGPEALALFRQVLLASASIPGLFPPVEIAVVAPGTRSATEMHADGGTAAPFYVAPIVAPGGCPGAATCAKTDDATRFSIGADAVYVIVNGDLDAGRSMTERSLSAILGRSIAIVEKQALRVSLSALAEFAARRGVPAFAAHLDSTGMAKVPDRERAFDPMEMHAAFELGRTRAGRAFTSLVEPGSTRTPDGSAPAGVREPTSPGAPNGRP